MTAIDNNQLLGDKPLESGHNLKQNKIANETPQTGKQRKPQQSEKTFVFVKNVFRKQGGYF